MTKKLDAQTVAHFLSEHPDFFTEYEELFAHLTVPHPFSDRTLSLAERQVMTLRERADKLSFKLGELFQYAQANETINTAIIQWCAHMLSCQDAQQIPLLITQNLGNIFDSLHVQLRLWGLNFKDPIFCADSEEELIQWTEQQISPYCGSNGLTQVHQWFIDITVNSYAMIPLRDTSQTFGLLVFASEDKTHFSEDMKTDFLQQIGLLASNALTRLKTR